MAFHLETLWVLGASHASGWPLTLAGSQTFSVSLSQHSLYMPAVQSPRPQWGLCPGMGDRAEVGLASRSPGTLGQLGGTCPLWPSRGAICANPQGPMSRRGRQPPVYM